MTMYCPNCGALMVWTNGSILHDPPTKRYECGYCEILVTKYLDGSTETTRPEPTSSSYDNDTENMSTRIRKKLHIR